MSIFPGTFPSLPGVSCDRFSGANLNSDQFFLSHCHSDHMVGLESLVTKLRSMNKVKVNHRIYCSSELLFEIASYVCVSFPLLINVNM